MPRECPVDVAHVLDTAAVANDDFDGFPLSTCVRSDRGPLDAIQAPPPWHRTENRQRGVKSQGDCRIPTHNHIDHKKTKARVTTLALGRLHVCR